jgi:hypothetical protein
MRPHGRALFYNPGNFKKDAIVRPRHGRPRGHHPSVRPSENVRVTTLTPPVEVHLSSDALPASLPAP